MNTFNRVLWTVIGAILALAGLAAILAYQGWLFGVDTDRTLFSSNAGRTWHRYGAWAPTLAIVAGVTLVVLGLLLLRAELRAHGTRRMRDLSLRVATDGAAAPGPGGRTRVDTSVFASAMRRDLQSDPRIADAQVRISGRPERPEVFVRLEVDRNADLHPIRERVEQGLDRLAATMPGQPIIQEVLVSSTRAAPTRVH